MAAVVVGVPLRSGRAIHFWERTHHWAYSVFVSQLLDIVLHTFLCPYSCVVPLLPPLCCVSPLRVKILSVKPSPSPGDPLGNQLLREVLLQQSHTKQITGGVGGGGCLGAVWFLCPPGWGGRWKSSSSLFLLVTCWNQSWLEAPTLITPFITTIHPGYKFGPVVIPGWLLLLFTRTQSKRKPSTLISPLSPGLLTMSSGFRATFLMFFVAMFTMQTYKHLTNSTW